MKPGIYAIWHSTQRAFIERCADYDFGVQVVVQWQDVVERKLPWTYINALHRRGLHYTFQVNGNHRPLAHFTRLPYYDAAVHRQNRDGKTLMYWHPAYLDEQEAMLEIIADMLQKGQIAPTALRQSYLAIGTEILRPTGHIENWKSLQGPWRNLNQRNVTPWRPALIGPYVDAVHKLWTRIIQPHAFVLYRTRFRPTDPASQGMFHTSGSATALKPALEKKRNALKQAAAKGFKTYTEAHQTDNGTVGYLMRRYEVESYVDGLGVRGRSLFDRQTRQFLDPYWIACADIQEQLRAKAPRADGAIPASLALQKPASCELKRPLTKSRS